MSEQPKVAAQLLVVDDDPFVLRAIARILRDVTATYVDSGHVALGLIAGGLRFAAVLCDVNMPGMDALRLYQEVARIDPRQTERFLFMTGGAFHERSPLSALLERRVIEKPFDAKSLRAFLAPLLSGIGDRPRVKR